MRPPFDGPFGPRGPPPGVLGPRPRDWGPRGPPPGFRGMPPFGPRGPPPRDWGPRGPPPGDWGPRGPPGPHDFHGPRGPDKFGPNFRPPHGEFGPPPDFRGPRPDMFMGPRPFGMRPMGPADNAQFANDDFGSPGFNMHHMQNGDHMTHPNQQQSKPKKKETKEEGKC